MHAGARVQAHTPTRVANTGHQANPPLVSRQLVLCCVLREQLEEDVENQLLYTFPNGSPSSWGNLPVSRCLHSTLLVRTQETHRLHCSGLPGGAVVQVSRSPTRQTPQAHLQVCRRTHLPSCDGVRARQSLPSSRQPQDRNCPACPPLFSHPRVDARSVFKEHQGQLQRRVDACCPLTGEPCSCWPHAAPATCTHAHPGLPTPSHSSHRALQKPRVVSRVGQNGTTAQAPQGSQLLPLAQEAGGFDAIFKLHASFRRRTGRGESSAEWEAPRMLPGRARSGREWGPQVRGAPAKADQPSISLLWWSRVRLLPTARPWPINAGRGQAPGACVLGG